MMLQIFVSPPPPPPPNSFAKNLMPTVMVLEVGPLGGD